MKIQHRKKAQVNEESRIEEEQSIEDQVEEKPSEQGNDTENKTTESEDILKDKCNDDGCFTELLEQPSKELIEQEGESNTEKEQDKSTNNSEEEKSIEDKENAKEDSVGQGKFYLAANLLSHTKYTLLIFNSR